MSNSDTIGREYDDEDRKLSALWNAERQKSERLLALLFRSYREIRIVHSQGAPFLCAEIELELRANRIDLTTGRKMPPCMICSHTAHGRQCGECACDVQYVAP